MTTLPHYKISQSPAVTAPPVYEGQRRCSPKSHKESLAERRRRRHSNTSKSAILRRPRSGAAPSRRLQQVFGGEVAPLPASISASLRRSTSAAPPSRSQPVSGGKAAPVPHLEFMSSPATSAAAPHPEINQSPVARDAAITAQKSAHLRRPTGALPHLKKKKGCPRWPAAQLPTPQLNQPVSESDRHRSPISNISPALATSGAAPPRQQNSQFPVTSGGAPLPSKISQSPAASGAAPLPSKISHSPAASGAAPQTQK